VLKKRPLNGFRGQGGVGSRKRQMDMIDFVDFVAKAVGSDLMMMMMN